MMPTAQGNTLRSKDSQEEALSAHQGSPMVPLDRQDKEAPVEADLHQAQEAQEAQEAQAEDPLSDPHRGKEVGTEDRRLDRPWVALQELQPRRLSHQPASARCGKLTAVQ